MCLEGVKCECLSITYAKKSENSFKPNIVQSKGQNDFMNCIYSMIGNFLLFPACYISAK